MAKVVSLECCVWFDAIIIFFPCLNNFTKLFFFFFFFFRKNFRVNPF